MNKTFHYTFRTYKGKQVLIGEIATDLGVLFQDICRTKGLNLIALNILVDHVHILLEKGPADSNEYVMKMIKGISSREIFKKYPSNRFEFRKLWGRGYHAVEIKDDESLDKTIRYIENQKVNGADKRALPGWKPRRLVAGFQPSQGCPGRSVSGFQPSKGTKPRSLFAGFLPQVQGHPVPAGEG